MAHEMILTEVVGRVGVLTFNRPEKLNAGHPVMNRERWEQVELWNNDPAVGAIVLTGAGRAFSAGADVRSWQQAIVSQEPTPAARAPRSPRDESWTQFVMRSKPIVCAINGMSVGAGLTLTLPCDVRIASDQARFSMKFVKMGVFPELASTHILPLLVGMGQALELMLSGKFIDALEAERIGLVNRVVAPEKLLEEAIAIAQEIAANPVESLLAIKRTTWLNAVEQDIKEVHRRERAEFAAARARPAHKEAVEAFLEKRPSNLQVTE